jgi:diguanylate cyclase (GGDEF)-like protein
VFIRSAFVHQKPGNLELTVLLASPDSLLARDLRKTFTAMGMRLEAVADGEAVMAALPTLEDSAVILLDVLIPGVANGRLLAAMQASGVHRRCAIALIAECVSDEWIARLREGVIDDIVPRSADAAIWGAHLSTMRRGHELLCELEHLRQASLKEAQHDRVTGALHRETMLTMLFRETDRVQRLHGSLCLILFAIDDFPYWSSELDRDACEALLREAAARTMRMQRSYDLLGRTGKDEFLLALPGCSTINAAMLAERMRQEVFGEPFMVQVMVQDGPENSIPIRLTACFGIASSQGRSPVVVLREAKLALALSRQSGPDTIRCTSESTAAAKDWEGLATLFPDSKVVA